MKKLFFLLSLISISINSFCQSAMELNNQGIDKVILKDYKGAIQNFTDAIRIDSTYIEAYNNRGFCKRMLGDNKGAIEDNSKAI